MGKKLSTYYSDNGNDYCEIHFDYKEEHAYIKYFDENWALGHKVLSPEHNIQYTLDFRKQA